MPGFDRNGPAGKGQGSGGQGGRCRRSDGQNAGGQGGGMGGGQGRGCGQGGGMGGGMGGGRCGVGSAGGRGQQQATPAAPPDVDSASELDLLKQQYRAAEDLLRQLGEKITRLESQG